MATTTERTQTLPRGLERAPALLEGDESLATDPLVVGGGTG